MRSACKCAVSMCSAAEASTAAAINTRWRSLAMMARRMAESEVLMKEGKERLEQELHPSYCL